VEQSSQATKTNWVTTINTNKTRKQREKERENTRNLFTQFVLILT